MRRAASIWPLLFLFAAQPGGKARLADFATFVSETHIAASFALENVFDDAFVERIQTGLPTGFDFRFKLVQPQKRWFDNTIATSRFQVVAMYNAVTREYLINYKRDGKLIESRVALEVEELRQAMTRFDDLQIFDLEERLRSRRLQVRARAALGSKNLFFLIPTTVKTDWAESEKFQLLGNGG